jgi:allene oxide cyclase
MRRGALIVGVIAAFVLGAATISIAGSDRAMISSPVVIRVVEHADTDAVTDTGVAGDTAGDLLTFANPVYNMADTKKVGRDQGDCIRIDPVKGKWECRWITWLGSGGIAVEGPFYDTKDSTMAVTGGTGRYANVRGVMHLHALSPTEFRFTFEIIP